ncbi:MAG TPA: Na+/H+ antiporter NhaA [Chitinophagaceae bacterium]|nr:Na+/H+ antiporter NhaA [Chitinophagaceae bacterium]
MRPVLTKLFTDFFNSEKAGGFLLIGCTVLSLIIANSGWGEAYLAFWHTAIGAENEVVQLRHPVEFWVNDGLMTIFFLLVGLEIERELYIGELSSPKKALLPAIAALGGMAIPAFIHFTFNSGLDTQSGFGIPMATDIAFALGILSLLGNKVPAAIKVFLAAFAIIDDLGAIIIIAVFYTADFSFGYFAAAMGIWGILFILNRARVHVLAAYLLPGVVMWYCMLQSGVHATITGVLLAFVLPFGDGGEKTLSYRLQHWLHKPVAFVILPLFALANTGIVFSSGWSQQLFSRNSLGIIAGLVIGKPVGIMLFSYLAVKMRISRLSAGIRWQHVFGVAMLGGIGFTMSVFITLLAFNDAATVTGSKIAILASSLIAGIAGFAYLRLIAARKSSGQA